MTSIYADIRKRGGTAATCELLRDGHTSHALTRAVRSGEILRIRQGPYGCPDLPPAEIQAVRVGGVATGLTAARLRGLWAPTTETLAVRVRPHSRALRTRVNPRRRLASQVGNSSTSVRWVDATSTGTRSLASLIDCLIDIASTATPIVTFAVVESALGQGQLTRTGLRKVIDASPPGVRQWLEKTARKSESGGESHLRFGMIARGIPHQQQIVVAKVGRVDFLIGDGLVIEADSAEFHTDPASFENDRRRDALLTARGYRVLRFSYKQITDRPDEVWAAIEAAMLRGDHWRA